MRIAEVNRQLFICSRSIRTALAQLIDTIEDRVPTRCGEIVPRITTRVRRHCLVGLTAICGAVVCLNVSEAQVGSTPERPAATAAANQPDPAPTADPLLAQLDTAIDITTRRYLTANSNSPWQIFHGLLALKRDFQLKLGQSRVNAIEWIATSQPQFDNQPLLLKTPFGGKFHPYTRMYAFEGHPAQFLALLSQSDLPVGFQFKVGQGYITINDIINNTMKEVNTREEVTWVLWALQHYLPTSAQWVNQFNEPWSIERLVQIETATAVVGAPCGGNHRLFALTRTRDKHLRSGGQLVGLWAQADYKIRQHIEIARSLQNADGTFSAKSYETSGYTNDLNERFNTSGHTMEFLSISLPDDRLNEQWVRNAVAVLSSELIANKQREIKCGPLFHTLNSLIIYRDRCRTKFPQQPTQQTSLPLAQNLPKLSATPSTPKIAASTAKPPATAAIEKPRTESGRLEAKPMSGGPSMAKVVPNKTIEPPPLTPSTTSQSPSTPDKLANASQEALNELKLDDATRDLLRSLMIPRQLPEEISNNSEAIPLVRIPQPAAAVADEPVSALHPANQP